MLRFRIKELAEARGMNRSQLQIKSGLSLGLIYRYWNNNTTQATFEALEKIAKALGVRPLELLTDEEDSQESAA